MVKLEEVITGERKKGIKAWASANKIKPSLANMIFTSIENPLEFIFFIGKMEKEFEKAPKKAKEEIRNALLRVQIWCSINSHRDPVMGEKQLFISQVIEKLFFGGNLLSEESIIEDKEE